VYTRCLVDASPCWQLRRCSGYQCGLMGSTDRHCYWLTTQHHQLCSSSAHKSTLSTPWEDPLAKGWFVISCAPGPSYLPTKTSIIPPLPTKTSQVHHISHPPPPPTIPTYLPAKASQVESP
jgi:hypothetical protein